MLIRSCCVASLYLFKNLPLLRIFGFVRFTMSLKGAVEILQMSENQSSRGKKDV